MTTLTPEIRQLIQNCTKDVESYHQITRLFEQHNTGLLETLRQQEAQYRAVVDQQIELVCRYLPDTTLTFVNEAYCRFFNKTADELIGRSLLPLLDEETGRLAWLSPPPLNLDISEESRTYHRCWRDRDVGP